MKLNLSQKVPVYIDHYPGSEKLNPKLHRLILEKVYGSNKGAIQTSWNEGFFVEEFKIISDYVIKIIRGVVEHQPSWELYLSDLWGQYYNKGDFQDVHNHNPAHWSFVYYVNAPKGSAPLVFTSSNKKVIPTSGMFVLFPAWLCHHVPVHKCEEIRSVIAGNLFYTKDWTEDKKRKVASLIPIK
tara:strand:- start:7 stop:558 length:552 start_codon:yes stop_codon:yes gene_type:complete